MKIQVDDKCNEVFKNLKFNKDARYIIYKIDGEKIVVEHVGQREANWGTFLKALPVEEYRFCVFDLQFKNHDGMNQSKIFFCAWLPQNAKIKVKMLYATAKENFKAYLDLHSKQICISTIDEMNEEGLIKQLSK